MNQRYRENQAVVEPLISYLQNVRTALRTDLTVGGLQAVKPLAENAKQNSAKVQTALGRLSDDLSDSAVRMSSMVRPEPEPKAGVVEVPQTTQERAQATP